MNIASAPVDADCLRFLGHVLEAYFAWRHEPNLQAPAQFFSIVGMVQPVEHRNIIDLSDDQFVRVDQSFAKSTWRSLLEIEYCDTGSVKQKARRAGYAGANYGAIAGQYRADILAAEAELYALLQPDIDAWYEDSFAVRGDLDRRRVRH